MSQRKLLRYGAALAGTGFACTCDKNGDAENAALRFLQFYTPGGEVSAQAQWFVDMVDVWNVSNHRKFEL